MTMEESMGPRLQPINLEFCILQETSFIKDPKRDKELSASHVGVRNPNLMPVSR